MADRLNKAGVGHARGFSLNIANFFTTEDEIGYGDAISAQTNGAHYVIDTSRNGAGPAPDSSSTGATPAGGHWALRPRRLPATDTSTLSCGSSVPVNPTDHATKAIRRRGPS